jgi:hypothetical protein
VIAVCGVCYAIAYFNFLEPPGVGAKAEAGYKRGEPIIKALESYHSDHSSYPDSLQMLVPDYLTSEQVKVWQETGEGQYEITDVGYRLAFNYIGPCMNHCEYDLKSGKWLCRGFC